MTDLNGDGDTDDEVLHVYDDADSLTANIGLAVGSETSSSVFSFSLDGDLIAIAVSESQQKAGLNDDGDLLDVVIHVYDAATREVVNLRLASLGFETNGNLVAFGVPEGQQAGEDLNYDRDSKDTVLHLYDRSTDTITNLGLAAGETKLNKNFVAFPVHEASQGETDLNDDGDATDSVLHILDLSTGDISNVGFDVTSTSDVEGHLVAFSVSEAKQGGQDLNNDGDSNDQRILYVYDARTGNITQLSSNSSGALISGNLVAFFSRGVSVYDTTTGRTTDFSLGTSNLLVDGNLATAMVWERSTGDLNGDGDSTDFVLHIFDTSDETATNLRLSTNPGFALNDPLLAFAVTEVGQGGTDLNNDGDSMDDVLHIYDASTGAIQNVGLDINSGQPNRIQLGEKLLAFSVREASQADTDLNDDGDTQDWVLHVLELSGMEVTNLSLNANGLLRQSGDRLALCVSEAAQGGVDLNADGDANDQVLHLVKLTY